jgi:hypothetical protein
MGMIKTAGELPFLGELNVPQKNGEKAILILMKALSLF